MRYANPNPIQVPTYFERPNPILGTQFDAIFVSQVFGTSEARMDFPPRAWMGDARGTAPRQNIAPPTSIEQPHTPGLLDLIFNRRGG